MKNKKGFTMVELLVVLVIVAILAAVATPIYLANVRRARVSEAISAMSLIRQALRDYRVNGGTYFDIASGNIDNALPTSVSTVAATLGNPTPATAGVDIDLKTVQYFSNDSFTVDAGIGLDLNGASDDFITPPVRDFLITADGSASDTCTTTIDDCATKNQEVSTYRIEMDNSGRIFVSYNSGTTWEQY